MKRNQVDKKYIASPGRHLHTTNKLVITDKPDDISALVLGHWLESKNMSDDDIDDDK